MIYGRVITTPSGEKRVQIDFDIDGVKELKWLLAYGLNTHLYEYPDLLALSDKLETLDLSPESSKPKDTQHGSA